MPVSNAERKRRRIIPDTLNAQTDDLQSQPLEKPPALPAAGFQAEGAPQQGELARTTAGGLRQLQVLGREAVGAGAALVGQEEFAQEQLEEAERVRQESAHLQPRVARIEDIGKSGDFLQDAGDYVQGVIGTQLPILATSIGGGIAGVVGRRALPKAAQRVVSPTAAATTGTVGVATGIETGSIFGDVARDPEAREQRSLQELARISVAGGAAAGSLEALPVISALRRFGLGKSGTRAIRSRVREALKGGGSQALQEGGTEALQTVIERAAAKFANENREILGEEGLSEILNASVAGTIVGLPTGTITGGFQRGSIEDQLDLEDSLDELELTGGTSSDIDVDLDNLGELGLDIRAARVLASETELQQQPEQVIDRIIRVAQSEGRLPTRRSFAQLTEAVRNLENPAQLDNILVDAGVAEELRPQLSAALRAEVETQDENYLSLAVEERPEATFEEAPPEQFQSPNVTRSHILRNRNGRLGFIASDDPQQENALRRTLDNLEQDFPDITFRAVGLGDAIHESLPDATRRDPEKANRVLRDVAEEKLGEPGFNAARFEQLDPSNARAFLNQFKAVAKEEVDVSLTGRDEFRLTDSDLTGTAKPGRVHVGGALKTEGGVKRPRATVTQPKSRPIFVKREVSKDGDFQVDARGKDQTVDAVALTNRMIAKSRHEGPISTQTAANAFFNGLSALVQRGVAIDPNAIPDSLIIHKGRGESGRETTWGEVKKTGAGRVRARILALKVRVGELHAELHDVNKRLGSDVSPQAKANLKRIRRKLNRRIKRIPTEIETLNIFGQSVSRDVQSLTSRLNDASELISAVTSETEGLQDIAVDIQELRRQLEREGFNTQAAEQLSNIGRQLQALDEFATETRKASQQRQEEEVIRFPTDPDDLQFGEAYARGIGGLFDKLRRKKLADVVAISTKVGEPLNTAWSRYSKKLNMSNARLLTGEEVIEALSAAGKDGKQILGEFQSGSTAGMTLSRTDMTTPAGETLLGGKDHVVLLNPYLSDERFLQEVLAHEAGHVVFRNFYNAASPGIQLQIKNEFLKWRKEQMRHPNREVAQTLATKKPFEAALRAMAGSKGLTINELNDMDFDYLMDFEEWFADQTARYLVPPPQQPAANTAVEKWFKGVADAIRELWDSFIAALDFRPARSVEQFLDDVIHSQPDIEMRAAKNRVTSAMRDIGGDTDNQGIAAVFQFMDPYSGQTNWTVREVMRDNLKPEERRTLFRYFNRRSTKERLKKLATNDKQRQVIENSPLHAAVLGYQMWIAGTFQLQKPSAEQADVAEASAGTLAGAVADIFAGLFDAITARLGFVFESEQAEQILDAIRDGTIAARKAGSKDFAVTTAVRKDVLQRVAQAGNDAFEHLKPIFDRALGTADARMLETGIPSLISIAHMYHAQVGGESVRETFFEARRSEIGKFMNSYTRLTADLQKNPELKEEVLKLLRNPKLKGSPEAIAHASQIRKLLRRVRNYSEQAGLDIGDRGKDYFPWVFDVRKVQDNSDFIRGLLNDQRFDKNIQGILKNLNDRIQEQNEQRNEDRPLLTKEQVIEHMMMGLEQSEGLADTNLNPLRSGTTPYFAAINKRTLGFLTDSGKLTAEERERFDSLFSNQLDLIVMTYIRQAVKRSEYTRRFGRDSGVLESLLEDARNEGATRADMRTAYTYIDAMNGVIGEETNRRVARVLGLGPREGEVINPHWRTFTSIAMVVQNLAVLPLATLTSLVDPVGIMVRSQDLNATMAALRTGAREIVAEVRLLAGGDEKKIRSELRKLAEGMGTIEDHMTNEALEWEYGSTYLTPRLKAANEFFFKAIGLTQWTRVTRLMALAGGKEFIKRHVQRSNDNSERFLRQLGISKEDVKFDEDGDIKILSRYEREIAGVSAKEIARDDRVRNALNRFVDESILRPNAAQRPIWASDPNYALIFHLKSFMWSFHDRILRRAAQEAEFGNAAPLILLAAFIPAMIFSDMLRDFLRYGTGGDPRKAKWGLEDHIWSATQRSGLNGIGQLLIDAKNDIQFGGLGYESLSGPTVDGISDLGGLFASDSEEQWDAFTRNLPFSTVWKHWLSNGFDE